LNETEGQLLEFIQSAGKDTKSLRRSGKQEAGSSRLAYVLNRGREVLSEYLGDVGGHIRSVSLHRRLTDRPVLTSREQYYLYMMEFELVNRVHIDRFRKANFKIALLPYCLKESQEDCRARQDEFDYRCMGCLRTCYIHRISRILKEKGINPYILSQGRVKHLLEAMHRKHGGIGVLGIACVVELVWGMRLCIKAKIPVVGIPLNANRCPRWMGRLRETSVDMEAIHRLLSENPVN
jgi:hypothetical protein